MKRAWLATFSVITGVLAILYAGWWWATALAALSTVAQVIESALFRWHEQTGWRRWYGLGGAITCVLVFLRFVPPFVLWLAREIKPFRPTPTSIVVGVPVAVIGFFSIPLLGTVIVATAWPVVLYLLARDAWTRLRRQSRNELSPGHGSP